MVNILNCGSGVAHCEGGEGDPGVTSVDASSSGNSSGSTLGSTWGFTWIKIALSFSLSFL